MLLALIDGKWSALPESMRTDVPAAGSVTTYQWTNKQYDSATKKEYYAATLQLFPRSVGYNPDTKRMVDIAMIERFDSDGLPIFEHLPFYPHRNGGYLNITHGHAHEDELYQYLELASFVGTNDQRDKSKEILLLKKDFKKDAEAELQKMELEHEAYGTAYALKAQELSSVANLLGVDSKMPEVQIRQQVLQHAKKDPSKFLALTADPDRPAKSILAAGIANGAFRIDEGANAIVDGTSGAVIIALSDTSRDAAMTAWAAKSKEKDGVNFVKGMTTLVAQKDKANKA